MAQFLPEPGQAGERSALSARPGPEGGVLKLKALSRFGSDGDSEFRVVWEDGQRIFCRGLRQIPDGKATQVLAVLAATDYPTASILDSFAHEYALRDELD